MPTEKRPEEYDISYVNHSIKNFMYREFSVESDEDGMLQTRHNGKSKNLGTMRLLFRITRDKNDVIIDTESISEVNNWLLYMAVEDGKKDTTRHADALLKYYWYLHDTGKKWDEFPYIKSKKPTYGFKTYLKDLHNSSDKDIHLSRNTANSYINSVVSFYKHHMRNGVRFPNAPFEGEYVKVDTSNDHKHMSGSGRFYVSTTDMRLNLPKDQRYEHRRELIALSNYEWNALDRLLTIGKRVLCQRQGQKHLVSLPEESCLMFRLMRYSGLRREEVVTLLESNVIQPSADSSSYIMLNIGPAHGTKTKNSKNRKVEIPTLLMKELHEYTLSERYTSRRDKYLEKHGGKAPLFIQYTGNKYSNNTVNARWGEIRRTLQAMGLKDFEHKPHNLRATYAVYRLRELRSEGKSGNALSDFLLARLGHDSFEVTEAYLKQSEEPDGTGVRGSLGQAVYEEALDYLVFGN
ncbi:TPA: site-specific integrase [Vibrio parahaemolyticus]|nr:site-specific integrase [Vibrio parahaemolyticus]HBC3578944.1 site-specific integrase [Vibrio parahaemolyticus]